MGSPRGGPSFPHRHTHIHAILRKYNTRARVCELARVFSAVCVLQDKCARIGIYLNCEPVGVRGQVVYMQHVSAVRPSARHVPAAVCVYDGCVCVYVCLMWSTSYIVYVCIYSSSSSSSSSSISSMCVRVCARVYAR